MSDSLIKINFQDIDYVGIKEGLISFLKTTQSFKDANFEGSFLSHLVNMFAYTGAIFGNYINAMASEQYIKTTQLYETGNMLGHIVGYKAHGFRGSKATINVTPDFEAMGIADDLLSYYGWVAEFPRNIQFSTKQSNVKNKTLIFTNTTDNLLTIKDPALDPSGNANTISLEVIQGIPMTIEFVSNGKALQSFEIPNPFIDYREIRVYVMNDPENEERWESVLTWFYASADSKIFIPFINDKGLLEIMFGEGNFGKIPEAGKTIRIEYIVTAGASGNVDADMITNIMDNIYFVNNDYSQNIAGQFTIEQPEPSSEGQNIETLDRIKRFAPFYYGIQNRLVNEFDYKWYILGAYTFLTDAAAFSYRSAVDAYLVKNPCQNEFLNSRWASYESTTGPDGITVRVPDIWTAQGFNEYSTVISGDTLHSLPMVDDQYPSVSSMLNFGTSTALFVDTSRACDDNATSSIIQTIELKPQESCGEGAGCTVVHFELEVLNPEIDPQTGEYPNIENGQIMLYIDQKECYTVIDKFIFNTFGYASKECCCDRVGDVVGWHILKGVALLDMSKYSSDTETVSVTASIIIKPNLSFLLGEAKIYVDSCLDANDIFVVPVPETGGYINTETKNQILEDINNIKMVTVRNHIIRPIYQVFDARIIFRKDETSLLSLADVSSSIRSKIVEMFLPINRKLGDRLNSNDFSEAIADLPGVSRARVILNPRTEYLQQQVQVNELGDFQLRPGDFPILGQIQLG